MQFNNLANSSSSAPIRPQQVLRADGNLNYLDFIRTLEYIWDEEHPDVRFGPTQDKNFEKLPCITYSLQARRPLVNEPKAKYRETVEDANGDLYWITGQRFENVVVFKAYSKDPKVAELLIETFEDFMDTHTGTLKRLGVSELVYARRIPDDDETRRGDDLSVRGVAYAVTLERVKQTKIDRIEQLVIRVKTYLEESGYMLTAVGDSEAYTVLDHPWEVGDYVAIRTRKGYDMPSGLKPDWIYQIYSANDNTIYLVDLAGTTVSSGSSGTARIEKFDYYYADAELVDTYSATPSH